MSAADESADAADTLKARLREDLRAAMRAKDALAVRLLRALIAAIDDAQAVPAQEGPRYIVRAFGDGSAEVPRLHLSQPQAQALLSREADARRAAAAEMRRLGEERRAEDLEREAALAAGYLDGPSGGG